MEITLRLAVVLCSTWVSGVFFGAATALMCVKHPSSKPAAQERGNA